MADWNTRLAVSYTKDGTTVDITPIDSFSPTFQMNTEILHSIEQTHIGMIYKPENVSFSMTVKAIGDVVAKLTKLAMDGTRFDVTLQESEGDDWSFASVVLSDCIITTAQPTTATTSGAPSAVFSGVSLGAKATDKANNTGEIPASA